MLLSSKFEFETELISTQGVVYSLQVCVVAQFKKFSQAFVFGSNVFAYNLKRQMELNGKSRNDIAQALNISYFTVSDWVNGKKYPRMDKVEMLASYFGILKSDLIEVKNEETNSPDQTILTEGEQKLLELFRLIPEENRAMVLEMIRAAVNTQG